MNVALVQNKITTSIKSGENGGVTLTNYNVVRNFKTISSRVADINLGEIDMIAGLEKKDFSLIIYLQDAVTHKIYAAAKSSL